MEDDDDNDDDNEPAESVTLPLPSTMPLIDQDPAIRSIEQELREAQAFELLHSLRKSLSERVALQRNQSRDQRGQKAKTRSSSIVNRVTNKIKKTTKRYQKTYNALLALGVAIHPRLQELKENDVSARNVFEYTQTVGRGDKDISWIWRQVPMGSEAQSDSWLEEGETSAIYSWWSVYLLFNSSTRSIP